MSESLVYTGLATNAEQIGKIAAKYQLTADACKNMIPVMTDIGLEIQEMIKSNFESQGRRKGGSWTALKKETLKRKARTPGALHIYEPVRLMDRLFLAATTHTNDTVFEPKQYSVVVGVKDIPYAPVQRFGGGNKIPARDYMYIDQQDRIRMLRLVEDYIFTTYSSGISTGARRPKGLGGYVFG